MASNLYNKAKAEFLKGNIAWESGTFKVMLVTASYTPNPDHNYVSSVNTYELSGTGYTGGFNGSGRKTLAGKAVTQDDANDKAYADANDVTWSAINAGTPAYAIIIDENTNDADSWLIACMDFADTATNGGDLTLQWSTSGIFRW